MAGYGNQELQRGVYDKLQGDVLLNSMINGEYDFVPEDVQFPYIVVDAGAARDYSVKDASMQLHNVEIHAFSRGRGKKEANEILGRVYELLNNGMLSVSGFTVVNMRYISSDVFMEPDGITYHGVASFRMVTA